MKKLLCVLAALMILSLVLIGCTPSEQQDGEPQPNPEDMLVLLENGTAQYRVVRSDRLTSTDVETKSAIQIVNKVRELTGTELVIATDYTGRGGTEEVP